MSKEITIEELASQHALESATACPEIAHRQPRGIVVRSILSLSGESEDSRFMRLERKRWG